MSEKLTELPLRKWLYAISIMVILTVISGLVLRFLYITSVKVLNFTNIMHAHSHLAILGWVYMAIIALFYMLFIKQTSNYKIASNIFMITAIITVVMFFAFIYQGYALYSIIFSSLHIIITYVFLGHFLTLLKKTNAQLLKTISGLYLKGSIFFLVVGSFGPWVLAYWNAATLPKDFTYDILVHTFLHFQINGWIAFAILAILLHLLERKVGILKSTLLKGGFWLYATSLFPSIILNVDWTQATFNFTVVAVIGWLMKFIGITLIIAGIFKNTTYLTLFTRWEKTFMSIALCSLFGKTLIEIGNTSPDLINLFMYSRSIVVGYLHLGLIGFASFALLAIFIKLRIIEKVSSYIYGIILIGFVSYELLLFSDGLIATFTSKPIQHIHLLLLVSTLILSIGVLLLIFKRKQQ